MRFISRIRASSSDADQDPFDIRDITHQPARLGVVTGVGVEVGAHAVLQTDRLADVNDRPLGIFHQVTARLGWKRGEDTLEFFGDLHNE